MGHGARRVGREEVSESEMYSIQYRYGGTRSQKLYMYKVRRNAIADRQSTQVGRRCKRRGERQKYYILGYCFCCSPIFAHLIFHRSSSRFYIVFDFLSLLFIYYFFFRYQQYYVFKTCSFVYYYGILRHTWLNFLSEIRNK